MNEQKIEVGTIVRHPNRSGWGPGKTLAVGGGGQVTVYFRDIEETKPGDAVKVLATRMVGLEIAKEQSEPMLDSLPPFTKGVFKGVRKPRLSLENAVQIYLRKEPGALDDPAARDALRESQVDAHEMWADLLGDGRGDELLDGGETDDVRRRLLKIATAPGVLRPDERSALERAIEDDADADEFLRALFAVAEQSSEDQAAYQRLIDAVVALPEHEGQGRAATWQVLTQFPSIACPEQHIQLNPVTARKCALRLNFDLRFTAELNWWTYRRLLKLANILLARLKPLGATDFFDVQPFMRVIAAV
jgi:hypothetical protein